MSSREMEVAEEAARAGGAVASRYFRAGSAVFTKGSAAGKSSYNLVSEADLDAERAIVAVIRGAFPDHAVLGEELHGGDGVSGQVLGQRVTSGSSTRSTARTTSCTASRISAVSVAVLPSGRTRLRRDGQSRRPRRLVHRGRRGAGGLSQRPAVRVAENSAARARP